MRKAGTTIMCAAASSCKRFASNSARSARRDPKSTREAVAHLCSGFSRRRPGRAGTGCTRRTKRARHYSLVVARSCSIVHLFVVDVVTCSVESIIHLFAAFEKGRPGCYGVWPAQVGTVVTSHSVQVSVPVLTH